MSKERCTAEKAGTRLVKHLTSLSLEKDQVFFLGRRAIRVDLKLTLSLDDFLKLSLRERLRRYRSIVQQCSESWLCMLLDLSWNRLRAILKDPV